MWATCNGIINIPGQFQHYTVNHRVNFVDPQTGATTNHVECMWRNAKEKFNVQRGPTNRDMVQDYMAEFMWSQRFGNSVFYELWNQIATQHYVVHT